MTEQNAFLKVEFSPAWQFIDDVRRFVTSFCANARLDEGQADAVAMSAHELLQNAVRHSVDGKATVTLEVDSLQKVIVLSVENIATPESVLILTSMKKRIQETPDAKTLYMSLMRETVGKSGSGLGLGRILFEGGMSLAIDIQKDRVLVRATCPLIPLVDEAKGPTLSA